MSKIHTGVIAVGLFIILGVILNTAAGTWGEVINLSLASIATICGFLLLWLLVHGVGWLFTKMWDGKEDKDANA